MMIKYQQNPGESRDRYDPRLDVAILRVRPVPSDVKARYDAQRAAWQADPTSGAEPPQVDDFELFLPENEDSVRGIKRKFSVTDPQNEDELLYDKRNDSAEPCFKFKKQRRYETTHSAMAPNQNPYDDNVAIALHDPETFVGFVPGTKSRLQKAAYYYPILQKTSIRAYRPKTINSMMASSMMTAMTADEEDEGKADMINITVVPEEEVAEDFYDRAEAQRQKWDHRMVVEGV
jgi:RNA polymerase II-associated factor 1